MWISVNDKLPERGVIVECLLENEETQDCYILDGDWESVEVNHYNCGVVSWRYKYGN